MGVDPFRYVSRYVLRPHMGDHSSFSDQSTKKSFSAEALAALGEATRGYLARRRGVDPGRACCRYGPEMGEARRGFWPSITVVIFV